jgi:hypothetical protein
MTKEEKDGELIVSSLSHILRLSKRYTSRSASHFSKQATTLVTVQEHGRKTSVEGQDSGRKIGEKRNRYSTLLYRWITENVHDKAVGMGDGRNLRYVFT